MIPSRPSPRAVGLPSSPRLRSTGETPTRYDREPDSPSGSRQRPLASISNPRARLPPLQTSEYRRPAGVASTQRASERPRPRHSPESAVSSSTSSGSPFPRTRLGRGYASSQTSVEQDGEVSKRSRLPHETINERRDIEHDHSPAESESDNSEGKYRPPPGDGYSIWNTVAAAASTLTVSVSKAWAGNIATASGEETPPGQESRLTRAMKAYHLEKARELSDLPDWLFTEHELQSGSRARFATREKANDEYDETPRPASAPQLPRARGLRDIYAAAATSIPDAAAGRRTEQPTRPHVRMDEGVGTSKAADRLRAFRDAKRSALVPNAHDEPDHSRVGGGGTFNREEVKRAQLPHRAMSNRLRVQS